MPGRDRTGPLGMGPMTGRRAGYCTGNATPGYAGYQGRDFGDWGRGYCRSRNGFGGRGRGFGWGYGAYPYPDAPDDNYRIDSLEKEARFLEKNLEAILRELA